MQSPGSNITGELIVTKSLAVIDHYAGRVEQADQRVIAGKEASISVTRAAETPNANKVIRE